MASNCNKTDNSFGGEKGHQQEMRIILLGKTGIGKSLLGNSICGRKEKNNPFKANAASSSVTRTSQCAYRVYNGRKLCVVDTPELSDTKQSNDIIIGELKKGLQLVCPGPHAFLIVVNGRCTDEQIGVLTLLQHMFGKDVVKYCIIVITREDDLRDNKDDQLSNAELIDQYFNEAPESLLCLRNDIQKRCILIENRASFEVREQKSVDLIDMIKTIEEKNGYYSNQMFIQAEQKWEQWEKDEIEQLRLNQEQQKKTISRKENLSREEALRREEQQYEEFRREEECLEEEIRDIRRQKVQQQGICGRIATLLDTLSNLILIPTEISYNSRDGWTFRFRF